MSQRLLVPPLPLPIDWRILRLPDGLSATRWLARVCGDLAERQHGVVTRKQLLELGFPGTAIDVLTRQRLLRAVHAGVYAVGHRILSRDGERLAAILACDGDAALTSWSASAFWRCTPDRPELHVTVVDDVHHAIPGLVVHRSRTLCARDVVTTRGITVTKPARTLIDLSSMAPRTVAVNAADEALRRGICTPRALRDCVDRHRGQPGRRVMLRFLDARRSRALRLRSKLEALVAELVLDAGLRPSPRFNELVQVSTGELLEVDVVFGQKRFAIEADGRAYHEGVVAELEDARRDALLEDAGWRVLRVTWWDVTREPQRLLQRVERELGHRVASSPLPERRRRHSMAMTG